MILSVCLNPSVDVALTLQKLKLGEINRANDVIRVAGGKGNNVARVIKILGEDIMVIEPIGGADGQFICDELNRLNISHKTIKINEPTRRCIAIIDECFITEVREKGPTITQDEYQKLLHLYQQSLANVKVITASGSLPVGIKSSAYADLINIAQNKNIPFLLDAKGEALYKGIKAKPTLVKINEEELSEWSGMSLHSNKQYINALRLINNEGIKIAIVSLGENGMLACWSNKVYKVNVPAVVVKSTVGCGDATLAGIAAGLKNRLAPVEILRLAAACGSAAAMQAATGVINLNDFKKLKKKVEITEL